MTVLSLSGIDTKPFASHPTRSSQSSKTKASCVPMAEILKAVFWSGSSIFKNFVYRNSSWRSKFSGNNTKKLWREVVTLLKQWVLVSCLAWRETRIRSSRDFMK